LGWECKIKILCLFNTQFLLSIFFGSIAYNGLQLGEVAEIEAQMFSFAQKVNRRTAVEFSTEPAILPNCCYMPFF
jgi:hypothetical protein